MDLVMVEDGVLDSKFCKEIISRYEMDTRHQPGITYKGLDPSIKNSQDLMIDRFLEWEDVCRRIDDILRIFIKRYSDFVTKKFPKPDSFDDTWHMGYQIQKSGHYLWHNDSAVEHGKVRVLTFIFYLNTVEGGETGFHYKQVNPVQGRGVMFPATWDYIHCGQPANGKYILTGWLYRNIQVKKIMT
jgi:hypothetical protein